VFGADIVKCAVVTSFEPLSNKYLKKALVRDMPEAVIKLNDFEYWVIESKRDLKDIDQALKEAKEQYIFYFWNVR
jgi:hypothetical protein